MLSKGLGCSKEDRDTSISPHRLPVARLLSRNGVVVIAAAISPYRDVRDEVRRSHEAPFVEAFLDCSIRRTGPPRQRKGSTRRRCGGEIQHFTGVSDFYEPPLTLTSISTPTGKRSRHRGRPSSAGSKSTACSTGRKSPETEGYARSTDRLVDRINSR